MGFNFLLLFTVAQEPESGEVRGKRIGQSLRLLRDRIADGLEVVLLLGNAQKSVC